MKTCHNLRDGTGARGPEKYDLWRVNINILKNVIRYVPIFLIGKLEKILLTGHFTDWKNKYFGKY